MPRASEAVVLFRRKQNSLPVRRDVSGSWICALPREKKQLFETVVRRWEVTYGMMSVALDEALSLRARGQLVSARQQVSIVSELLVRLAATLIGACDAMSDRGRHVSGLPVVAPLNVDFFRGDTAQSAASWNGLLHHVLLGDRSRFFHKLRILSGTVQGVANEFCNAAQDISDGVSIRPGACWTAVDSLHYDLSTCLRETEVVFKCFLRTLPNEQVSAFSQKINAPAPPLRLTSARPRLTRVSA
jgi:hypothetical protein